MAEFLKSKTKYLFGTFRSNKPTVTGLISYTRCDFARFREVKKLIQKIKPTHIFHLVGQSSPSLSWKFPLETVRDNVFSTFHLLEACREIGLKPKVLLVSSAHVYGRACFKAIGPSEKDRPQPLDPYASAKLQAESFARQYWEQFQIPSVIIRASAHVGTRQPPVFAISNFCKQISEIEKGKRASVITVGNLKAERGFVAVEDMVRAHWLAIQKGKPGEIYNVAASKVKTMREWLSILLRLTKVSVRIESDVERRKVIEPTRLFVNSRKFRQATGWHETITPEDAFKKVLDWWRSHV